MTTLEASTLQHLFLRISGHNFPSAQNSNAYSSPKSMHYASE